MKQWCGIIVSFLVMIGASTFAADSQWPSGTGEKIVFVGDPGVGKSALLNSLMGMSVFRSGLCAGEGLTKLFQAYSCNGMTFVDTPGLNDIKYRKEAAQQIEKALKGGGDYRIFYVLNLKNLRIIQSDIAAMNLIMDAINVKDLKFNVIINNVSKREMKHLNTIPQDMAAILLAINSLHHKTDKITIIPEDSDFEDQEGQFVVIEKEKRDFIFKHSNLTRIRPDEVRKIEIDKYEQLKKQTDDEIEKLRKEIASGSDRIRDLTDQIRRWQQQPKIIVPREEGKERDKHEDSITPLVIGILGGIITVVSIFI